MLILWVLEGGSLSGSNPSIALRTATRDEQGVRKSAAQSTFWERGEKR
jgi:hypothetical protein